MRRAKERYARVSRRRSRAKRRRKRASASAQAQAQVRKRKCASASAQAQARRAAAVRARRAAHARDVARKREVVHGLARGELALAGAVPVVLQLPDEVLVDGGAALLLEAEHLRELVLLRAALGAALLAWQPASRLRVLVKVRRRAVQQLLEL